MFATKVLMAKVLNIDVDVEVSADSVMAQALMGAKSHSTSQSKMQAFSWRRPGGNAKS